MREGKEERGVREGEGEGRGKGDGERGEYQCKWK